MCERTDQPFASGGNGLMYFRWEGLTSGNGLIYFRWEGLKSGKGLGKGLTVCHGFGMRCELGNIQNLPFFIVSILS